MTDGRQAERVHLMRTGHAPPSVRHGLPSTYTNWGCRCPECTKANTKAWMMRYRARKRNQAWAESRCPQCGSTRLTAFSYDGGKTIHSWECYDCGHTWKPAHND